MRFDPLAPNPRDRTALPFRLAVLALAACCWHAAQAQPLEPTHESASAPVALLHKIEHGLKRANLAAARGTRTGLEAAFQGAARGAHAAAPYVQRGTKAVERVAQGVAQRVRRFTSS